MHVPASRTGGCLGPWLGRGLAGHHGEGRLSLILHQRPVDDVDGVHAVHGHQSSAEGTNCTIAGLHSRTGHNKSKI